MRLRVRVTDDRYRMTGQMYGGDHTLPDDPHEAEVFHAIRRCERRMDRHAVPVEDRLWYVLPDPPATDPSLAPLGWSDEFGVPPVAKVHP